VSNVRARFPEHWFVGETGQSFACVLLGDDGLERTDVKQTAGTAVVKVWNRTTSAALVTSAACMITNGTLEYYPTSGQLAAACAFVAHFEAQDTTGRSIITDDVEGRIEAFP
jgi:hypothetical protein